MADDCGRTVVFPKGRSVTSDRADNAMARLQPFFCQDPTIATKQAVVSAGNARPARVGPVAGE